MSTLKADTVTTKSDNTDLTITGGGTGVPNLEAGFKVGGSAGVPTASIQDDAVTLAKLAAGTDGELITWDASGDPAAVAVGTATHVLTSNGAGAAPTFQAAAGGGAWNLIASSTYPAAVTWTLTGMDTTYDLYCFSFSGVTIANDNNSIFLRIGDSGGIKTDAEYNYNISKNGTVGATHDAGVGSDDTKAGPLFNDAGNAAGENGSGVLWIHRTGNNCNINGTITYQKATPIIQTGYCGIWYNASSFDITQVQLLSTTGNFTSGRMTLWGIAHA